MSSYARTYRTSNLISQQNLTQSKDFSIALTNIEKPAFRLSRLLIALIALLNYGFIQGCSDEAPNSNLNTTTQILEKSAAIPQKKDPIEALNIYMNRFHFHSKQMKAHHYCSIISKEFYQCSIYNGNNRNSKLIGVEYIVSHRIFESFDSN